MRLRQVCGGLAKEDWKAYRKAVGLVGTGAGSKLADIL